MKEWERAAAPGQPGQLALQSGWACPTNRPRLFSQLCSEHLQGWPGTPRRAWERVASQDTSSTLFHLRCQILRQRKHTPVCQNSSGCCALIFPVAPGLAAKAQDPVYLRAGDLHPLVNSGRGGGDGTWREPECSRGRARAVPENAVPDPWNQVPTALSLSQHLAAEWLRHKEPIGSRRGSGLHGRASRAF